MSRDLTSLDRSRLRKSFEEALGGNGASNIIPYRARSEARFGGGDLVIGLVCLRCYSLNIWN